jgi:prevent-host-death family protein
LRSWDMLGAKRQLGRIMDLSLDEGPQLITENGENVAVIVGLREWEYIKAGAEVLPPTNTSDEERGHTASSQIAI